MKQTTEKISRSIDAKMHFLRSKIAELHKEEGVTLIELLAVVVILGIIAIIAIPTVTNAVAKSKLNATMTTEATIQTALERYVADHGQYPATLTQLAQQTFGDGAKYVATGSSDTSGGPYGPYLTTSFPQNDGWGNSIYYAPLPSTDATVTPTATPPVTSPGIISGYVLLSGNGTQITFTSNGPQSTNGFVYAAGGTDFANQAIGYSPSVTDTGNKLPTYTAGTTPTISSLYKDVNAASGGTPSGTYTNLPTFTSK